LRAEPHRDVRRGERAAGELATRVRAPAERANPGTRTQEPANREPPNPRTPEPQNPRTPERNRRTGNREPGTREPHFLSQLTTMSSSDTIPLQSAESPASDLFSVPGRWYRLWAEGRLIALDNHRALVVAAQLGLVILSNYLA